MAANEVVVPDRAVGDIGEVFFFNDTATTEIYTLSLHDALPISWHHPLAVASSDPGAAVDADKLLGFGWGHVGRMPADRRQVGRQDGQLVIGPGCQRRLQALV